MPRSTASSASKEHSSASSAVVKEEKYSVSHEDLWSRFVQYWKTFLCVFLGVMVYSLGNIDYLVGKGLAYYAKGLGQLLLFVGCVQVGQIFVKEVHVEGEKFKQTEERKKIKQHNNLEKET
eukprot:CFRG4069T1